MKYLPGIILFFVISAAPLLGQQYGFRQYQLKDGLPQSQVGRIAEDAYGRLWVGTYYGGVARFDGQAFSSWGKADGLMEDEVVYITTTPGGQVYVVTTQGITRFEGADYETYMLPSELIPDLYIAGHAAEYAEDKLWLGTRMPGLHYWTPDTLVHLTAAEGYVDHITPAIAKGTDGSLWFGTEEGWLIKRERGEFIVKDSIPGGGKIYSLTADGYDRWWLATEKGIFLYQYGKITEWLPGKGVLEGYEVYRIALDLDGGMWASTSAGGVFLFEHGEFFHFGDDDGLTEYEVIDVYTDQQGNVWIATDGSGLFQFVGRLFSYLTEVNGLGAQSAYSMVEVEDRPGQYWLVTDEEGVQRFENGELVTYSVAEGVPDAFTNILYKDQQGKVWVGTESGAGYFDGQRWQALPFPGEGYENRRRIKYFAEDYKGNLWMGGVGHLSRWDGEILNQWKVPDSLAYSGLLMDCIRPLRDGRVLIGEDKHLLVFDPETEQFAYFLPEQSVLHSYYTMQVIEDPDGTLWFAVLNYGVLRYQDGVFTTFSEKEGLSSNQLYIMHRDRHHNLWLGSQKGVDRVRFDSLGNLASVRHYGVSDGFKGQEVQAHAVMEASNGTLWFGSVNGIMIYNPRHDGVNPQAPLLYMKRVRLFFEDVDWKARDLETDSLSGVPMDLALDYRENHISFNFAAIDLKYPEKVRYRYRLLPGQEEWSPAIPQGEAVFSGLSPGNYAFQVIAANHSGAWTDVPLVFSFRITPPIWRTPWFYLGMALITAFGITLLVRYRLLSLKRSRALLELMVEKRTTELNQKNHKLEETSQHLKSALEEVADKNFSITQSLQYARRIQEAILPSPRALKARFAESFVLYRPKDIVSGDFFWFAHRDELSILAVADCTGHGVPGAFMSMIGNTAFNQIVKENNVYEPGEILNRLRQHIVTSLQLDAEGHRRSDGMDVAVISYHHGTGKLHFAGAKRPLYRITEGRLEEYKGNFEPIGYMGDIDFKGYETVPVNWKPGDMLYLSTDGFADQFGGPKEKKFMVKRLKDVLVSVAHKPMYLQWEELDELLLKWKGAEPQTDDILLIGLRHPGI